MSAKYTMGLDTADSAVSLVGTAVVPVLAAAPVVWPTGESGDQFQQRVITGYRTLADLKAYFEGGVADVFESTTAIATPSAFAATTFAGFASTVSGATLMGYGTTGDVTLKNRAGTDALYVVASTTGVVMAGVATLTLSTAGAAFAVQGTTTALTADVASGAVTVKANVGTGTGAVGGFIFQVPVTHGSDSVAQTLTTVLTLDATTVVRATIAGATTINGAVQLGTSAGTDVTTIGGTGYGAGAASLRLNGLTTAAVTNQTGTLLNAPVAGNPTFWAPVSIAGVIKYIPCF